MAEARARLEREQRALQVDADYNQLASPLPEKPQAPFGLNHVSQLLGTAGQSAAANLTGAAGNAAAGMEAGGVAGAVGVAGAIVAGVMELKKMASASIKGAGEGAQSVARLDAEGLYTAYENASRIVPVFGDLVADASKEIRGMAHAVSETSRRLSEYNGELAVANAKADVAQILGDIRRASPVERPVSIHGHFE